ncbi:MAG: PssD/Cps14F family polysaccharide biosynthesis glycosyltransferase [Sedimentisphaerales bacterium]
MVLSKNNKMKICLTASAGGHLTELLKLADGWQEYEVFYVSTANMVAKKLRQYGPTHVVGECNREHLLRVILVLMRCIGVILRERPNVVISTGAAVGCIVCYLGKLLGAKVIWIDSIANVEWISLSGRMVRHIADLFLVQWPELAERYSNVEYVGAAI